MSLRKHFILLASVLTACVNVSTATVVQYNTVNAGLNGTEIWEVRNNKLVGFRYESSSGFRFREEGFITNIATGLSSIYNFSGARSTQLYAISTTDNNTYGGMAWFGPTLSTRVYGFLQPSSATGFLSEPPYASSSSIEGIYGNSAVGWVQIGSSRVGFFRYATDTTTTFIPVDYTNSGITASSTEARGVFGNIVVGTTNVGGTNYGFAWNSLSNQFTDLFLAAGSTQTFFNDINDGLIVGTATLNGKNTPFLLEPNSGSVEYFSSPQGYAASGKSYDNGILAGTYVTSNNETLGYYANVPEPSSLFLALFAASLSLLYPRRRKT
jgi:hypothetical protein